MGLWFALALLTVVAAAARVAALARRRSGRGRVCVRLTVADRGESVEALVRGILKLLAAYGGTAPEMVVVDAGSSDDTPEILARLAAEHPQTLKMDAQSFRRLNR